MTGSPAAAVHRQYGDAGRADRARVDGRVPPPATVPAARGRPFGHSPCTKRGLSQMPGLPRVAALGHSRALFGAAVAFAVQRLSPLWAAQLPVLQTWTAATTMAAITLDSGPNNNRSARPRRQRSAARATPARRSAPTALSHLCALFFIDLSPFHCLSSTTHFLVHCLSSTTHFLVHCPSSQGGAARRSAPAVAQQMTTVPPRAST